MNTLLCGTAEMDMKLPIGMDLTGFIAREPGSIGIHDTLKIRCLAIDDGSAQIMLIVCDLLGLSPVTAMEISELTEQQTGVPAAHVIPVCTHTHSGPASLFLQDCGSVDTAWLEALKADMVSCATLALTRRKPCVLVLKAGSCPGNLNRVSQDPEEALRLRDTQVLTLEIRDAVTGQMDTLLVNYPCHAVTLTGDNRLFSKDYPHYMEQLLKADFAEEPHVIFTNGCCGDLNPIHMGGFEAAEDLGGTLAESIRQSRPVELQPDDANGIRLKVRTFTVPVTLDYQLSEEALASERDHWNSLLLQETTQHGQNTMSRVYRAYRNWAEKMLDEAAAGLLPVSIEATVRQLRIGKLLLVALPFEAFHDVGLQIKQHFGDDSTMILGYAGGVYGYLPSRAQYHASRYEAKEAYKYFGYPGPLPEDAEDLLCERLFEEI